MIKTEATTKPKKKDQIYDGYVLSMYETTLAREIMAVNKPKANGTINLKGIAKKAFLILPDNINLIKSPLKNLMV